MTAQEIRNALRQTLDLAPAVAKAAEIVASAEQAETTLTEQAKRKASLDAEIASLAQVAQDQSALLAQIMADVEQAKSDAQAERAALSKQVGAIQEQVETARLALEAVQQAHAAFIKQADADKQLKQSELDGVQRDLDALVAKLRP